MSTTLPQPKAADVIHNIKGRCTISVTPRFSPILYTKIVNKFGRYSRNSSVSAETRRSCQSSEVPNSKHDKYVKYCRNYRHIAGLSANIFSKTRSALYEIHVYIIGYLPKLKPEASAATFTIIRTDFGPLIRRVCLFVVCQEWYKESRQRERYGAH